MTLKIHIVALGLPVFATFYKFIANIIIDRLNFCESNYFMLATLADRKVVFIIR